jgi:hypothetical protein
MTVMRDLGIIAGTAAGIGAIPNADGISADGGESKSAALPLT